MQKPSKSCFISYSHEGMDLNTLEYLIHILKEHLGSGAKLLYDQQLGYGEDFAAFMAMLDEVDVVLILLSPSYRRKIIDRQQGGVYEEFRRIWARHSDQKLQKSDRITDNRTQRFELIPILFSGSHSQSTPNELSTLKQLDLTGLRVTRKSNGEFQVSQHVQNLYVPQIQALASQIHAAAAVKSKAFTRLSKSYYDRLFVDLKANFNDPTFAGHDYINTILVKTSTYLRIESQLAYFVIGRKGSGKSTLTQVLPLVHPDRYQGLINIIADDFNLESLYTLYSDQQFRSDVNAAVSRDRAFELTWEGLLMLATMEAILELDENGLLNSIQGRLISPMKAFVEKMKGTSLHGNTIHWRTGDLFNYAFNATMAFVRECIDGARSDPAVFLVDIGVRFSRERYLSFVFGSDVVDSFRTLLRTFNKRFLVTLDGFDTAFDKFRLDSIREHDEDKMRRRAHFEVDWLRSLLSLAMQARNRGQDYFYSTLDFCIAAPKDRFMEVIRVERDSYRHWQRWCTLHWSGIELAILLRKRLEVLADDKTRKEASPRERLEEILQHKMFRHIPRELDFEYNGRQHKIPLFIYVLRHTFWRPREVLVYYSAILALAEDMKRWDYEVTTEVVRKCVKATTRQIIESEFLTEFHSTVVNIRDIVRGFKKCRAVLPFENLRSILSKLEFKFASGKLDETEMMEKIRFLYEIGFIGVKADTGLRDEFGLDLEHAFYFNEGSSLFLSADEDDMRSWEFVLHPIFSEYLRLDTTGQDLTLQFTWDYLYKREAFFSANPNA
jgi:energy-coupling factor transporter ATP-binding protein EcfA2